MAYITSVFLEVPWLLSFRMISVILLINWKKMHLAVHKNNIRYFSQQAFWRVTAGEAGVISNTNEWLDSISLLQLQGRDILHDIDYGDTDPPLVISSASAVLTKWWCLFFRPTGSWSYSPPCDITWNTSNVSRLAHKKCSEPQRSMLPKEITFCSEIVLKIYPGRFTISVLCYTDSSNTRFLLITYHI